MSTETDTSSEAHRLACEARHLLTWPLSQRQAYLADIPKIRGESAAQALREAVRAEWMLRRTQPARPTAETEQP